VEVIGNGSTSAVNVVGLDLGRRNIKLFTGHKYIWLPAIVGEWRDIKLDYRGNSKGYQGVFNGEKFFAGTLAEDESEFPRQMLVEKKATPDALLLALIALHQTQMTDFDVVTGVPVSLHDKENKESIINLLKGRWDLELNGVKRTINIARVRVAVEAGGAFWSNPRDGVVRIVDGGSKTINYITMKNKKYVDRDSGTMPFGFDTNKSSDHAQMVTSIAGELGKKWGQNDIVFTTGGEAEKLAKYLKIYFPYADVLQERKKIMVGEEEIDLNMFSNAIGYYNIGRTI
jgi:plasmid segregation protein ParM